jgi:hypothetical protein
MRQPNLCACSKDGAVPKNSSNGETPSPDEGGKRLSSQAMYLAI